MYEELPRGWVKTTLGEIVELSRERALPVETPDSRYVGLEHIEPQTMRLLGYGHARDVRSSSMRFSKGDMVYGKMRPYLNKIWVAEFDGLCSAEFLVFPACDKLNSHFLARRLNADDFVSFANGQVSGERPRVDFARIASFTILLPPLAEQERIVTKLAAALNRMANGEKAARRALERLQRYRAVVLQAAVTGELTREWREAQQKNKKIEPETGEALLQRLLAVRRKRWEEATLQHFRAAGNEPKDDKWKTRYREPALPKAIDLHEFPSGWCWASIEQLLRGADGMAYGVLKPGPLVENGVPMLRVMDITQDGHIAKENVYRISANLAEEFKRTRLETGDVLLSVMGTVGRTAVVPESITGGNVNRAIAVLKLIDPSFAEFLHMVLMSPLLQGRFSSEKLGTAQQRINLADLRWFAIPLPPANEQNEIIHKAELRLAAAYRLAATIDLQLERERATRQSLLREAFTGVLVPQDPHDESASVLLKRILYARETEAKKPKGKPMQKSRTKMKVTRRPLLDVLQEHKNPMTPEQLFRESGYEAAYNESDTPQDIVDAFYKELRNLTDEPAKVAEQKDSRHQVWLRALP